MKVEFNFFDENDREVAEKLFDKFSNDYNTYYVVPNGGGDPAAGCFRQKLMAKQMFLHALQSISNQA